MLGLTSLRRVIIAGLLVRLVMAPFFAHSSDMYAFYQAGESFLGGSQPLAAFLYPYQYSYFFFVFPSTLLYNAISPHLPNFTIPVTSISPVINLGAQWEVALVPGLLFDFLLKCPLILADAVTAFITYKVAFELTNDSVMSTSAALLYFLNPVTIWTTAGWGMFDALPALFTILSLYLLIRRRFLVAGTSLAAAVAMKYFALVLIIPLLYFAWKKGGRRGLLWGAAGSLIPTVVLLLPSLMSLGLLGGGASPSELTILVAGSSPTGLHYSGLSFWSAITLFYSGFSQTLVSSFLVLFALLATYVTTLRLRWENENLTVLFSFMFPIIAVLFFFRIVHENFFVWLIPSAACAVALKPGGKPIVWSIGIVAFVSSITNSLLPYYLLPLYPWIGGYLVEVMGWLNQFRVAPGAQLQGFCCGGVVPGFTIGKLVLASLGVSMSILLLVLAMKCLQTSSLKSMVIGTLGRLRGAVGSKETLASFSLSRGGTLFGFQESGRVASNRSQAGVESSPSLDAGNCVAISARAGRPLQQEEIGS